MIKRIILFLCFLQTAFAVVYDPPILEKTIKYDPDGPNPIGYFNIHFDRPIDNSTYIYIKLGLEEFKKKKVKFIILDLNTPGGEVFAAQKIAHALQRIDVEDNIPVIAFVDSWAVSAGAMLAYSCRLIAVTKTSNMGAAEPVFYKEGKMETASEKVNSALRAEFSNLASFYGRNPSIAEAMVDKDIILVDRDGSIMGFYHEADVEPGDKVISPRGKLLSLNAKELLEFGVADFEVHGSAILNDPFFENIPNKEIILSHNWRIGFFSFLSHPVVASLLFLFMMVGFYIEMNSPGFGLPGIIAAICLFLIILSNTSIYAVNWLEVVILGVGLLLVIIEFFFLAGFGFIGIIGIILSLVGLFLLMLPGMHDVGFSLDSWEFSLAAHEVFIKFAWLMGSFIVGLIVIFFLSRYVLPHFSFFSGIIHKGEQSGYRADARQLPAIGEEGMTESPLRPMGKIMIKDEIYDAYSEEGFIDKGIRVIIIRIEGNKITVRKC